MRSSERYTVGRLTPNSTNRWQAAVRAALAPFGLTHVQFVLLAALTWSREPATQAGLAHRVRVDPMMTSQVLRALERKSLVERHPHPGDGRARLLGVTPAGAALAQRANAAVEAADAAFFGPQSAVPQPLTRHLAALDERNQDGTPRPGSARRERR